LCGSGDGTVEERRTRGSEEEFVQDTSPAWWSACYRHPRPSFVRYCDRGYLRSTLLSLAVDRTEGITHTAEVGDRGMVVQTRFFDCGLSVSHAKQRTFGRHHRSARVRGGRVAPGGPRVRIPVPFSGESHRKLPALRNPRFSGHQPGRDARPPALDQAELTCRSSVRQLPPWRYHRPEQVRQVCRAGDHDITTL
jgi:hypothetical protein